MITVEEARKILGKRAEKLSDQEVEKLISLIAKLCNNVLDRYEAKNG